MDYSLSLLEQVINAALRLDEDFVNKLIPLQGKSIQLTISPLNFAFFIKFHADSIQLCSQLDHEPDTIIHSNPISLIRLSLLPASKARSLFNGHIQISGDIELGQHVKQLLDSIDIDWEGYLGQFTGEIVAHQIGRIVKKSTDFTTQLRVSIKEQLSEYVHEECRLFPPQEEVEDFYNDLDALSLRVERLEAHLNHYRAKP